MTDSFNQPGFLNFVVAQYSGARPWIADFSGLPIETSLFGTDRFLKVTISGQAVTTSVSVSLSGVALNVSGNVVYFTSGQNAVQNSGQTVYLASGFNPVQNSGQVVYLASGFNEIAGSFTANVSGQPVNVSGNAVRISGSAVVISGQTVVVPFTSISGNVVKISGETVSIAGGINVSGSPVRVSGEVVYPVSGLAFNKVFDPSGVTWNDWWVDASGSNRPLVAISGQTILGSVSGNVVKISGETVQIAGGVSVSGNMVSISGQPVAISGSMVSISGQPVSVSGNAVRISGETVQIAGGVSVSGNVVYPVSGFAFNKAFDPSGVTWNDVWVDASGSHRVLVAISGQPVGISGSMISVSGQPVSVSGNMISVSGQPVSVSGNAVRISGSAVVISGQVAYLTSGQNTVAAYGFIDASGQFTQLRVTQSGQNISGIPHKLAVTFSGDSIIGSVSGNMVSVSGQPVSVSGNMVSVSGQAVNISGQTVVTSVSGIALNISGNVVYLTSGQNAVQNSGQKIRIQAFDPSGVTWNDLIVNASGSNILRVDAGSIQVSANVSGNVVYLTSGQNNVQMSGQTVYVASGRGFVYLIDGAGGSAVAAVDLSADTIGSNDPSLYTIDHLYARNLEFNTWPSLSVTASGHAISGIVNKLVVGLSGDPVTVSGNVVNTSGNVNYDFGTVIRTTSGTIVTSLSGGTELGSGVVINATIRNLSGNAPMYIGGTGSEAPFSGKGMILFTNESQTYDIDNFNRIRVFANTSGQRVRVIGVAAN